MVYASRAAAAPAVVILSEFMACARVLNGGLRVNPWDTQMVQAHAIRGRPPQTTAAPPSQDLTCLIWVQAAMARALAMGLPERLARRERDMAFIRLSTLSSWAQA